MALKQHADHSYDALTKLSEQQLRSILKEEMESEDVDYELVKSTTDVLAAKTGVRPFDPECSYQHFISEYAETSLLYDEAQEAANEEDAQASEGEASAQKYAKKGIHLNRRIKTGLLVAAIIALLCIIGAAASAKGFDILHAHVSWDSENIGVTSVDSDTTDPYYQTREALRGEGITGQIVPNYMPEGYALLDFTVSETPQARLYDAFYGKNENMIYLSVSVLVSNDSDYNEYYPKDDPEPETYSVNRTDHYIFTNEGKYGAVWGNENVICNISGIESREELLHIIDSIYEDG